jgi:serine/threonine protein kinase
LSICHRDLKPANVLVDPERRLLKVCDLGSAKEMQPNQTNIFYICSRYYRAPELLLGYDNYNTEIDLWSIGCILVEFLMYEPVFPGESSLEQMLEIIKLLGTPT